MSSNEEITSFSPLSYGTCRFCNSYGYHRTLTDEYKTEDECEVYFDMIQECFNLHVTTGDNLNCQICLQCINRLTDSVDFRKMVIESEIMLQKTFTEKVDFEEVDEIPEYLEIKSEPDKLDDILGSNDGYTDYEVLEDDDGDVLCDQKEHTDIPIEVVSTASKEAKTPVAQKKSTYSKKDLQRAAQAVWNCEMNCGQASRHYNVPRTTLQTSVKRLQQKKGGRPRNIRQLAPPTRKLAYTVEDLLEAAEAVHSGKMSNGAASRHFGVPRTTLATHVRRLTDKDPESQNSHTRLQRTKYDVKDLQKAAEAVQSGKMSNRAASRHYNVPDSTLATYVRRLEDPDKVKSQKKGIQAQKTPPYAEENLKKAAAAVRDLKMNYDTASAYYNVPRAPLVNYVYTYYGTMADLRAGNKKVPGQPIIHIMIKHNTNITNIMEYTNATPIRCHSDAGYSCSFCTNQYMKPEDLKYHTIHAHDMTTKRKFTKGKSPSAYYVKLDITSLKCNICNVGLDSLENLMRHLNYEHDKKMYTDIKNRILPFKFETDDLKCAICGQFFGTFKILLMHMNLHYPNYVCKVCDGVFLTRTILIGHENSHKSGVFKCDECSKVFVNERTLKMHRKRSHVNLGYSSRCGHCGERFKSYQAKVEHLKTVHNIFKMLNCKACDKTFKLQASLSLHWKRVHLMERTVKCDDCDMKFFNKMSLNKHKLKHSGIRRFQCEFCLNSYQTQSSLREHIRIHKNDRRFKCEHCGMAFVQKCSWRAHMKNKHKFVC